VVAALPGRPWSLLVASPEEGTPAADLYIWDWDGQQPTGRRILDQPRHGAHLLVIGREEAQSILADPPVPALTLVLKPVNHDALRTFLQHAAERNGSLRDDRDSMFDCLLATTLRLQEYDQDRMNFLARAVHDFRTPLTAVNGYCGLLLSGQLGPLTGPQQEVLERTLHSVRRLGRLATALFQWSSGVRVGLQSKIREADIEECCRQALYEINPLAAAKNIAVDLDLQPPGQQLCFDPAQMEQLLVNLLENSCKFTPRGGYIAVRGFPAFWERRADVMSRDGVLMERRQSCSRDANAYRMEVSDNGMGVRPEHLQSIFQEYTSYGGGSDRSGSGLGLAICRRILAEHGGHIFAESGSKGVTFVFMLPFTKPAPDGSSGADCSGIHLVSETVGKDKT
jgi:signal transduction histidine kinase